MGHSAIDPIGPAIERAKLITFAPFDVGKWFVIGFVAWLATLGERGFTTPNFNANWGRGRPVPGPAVQPHLFKDILNWISSNPISVILVVMGIALLVFTVALLIIWISSRGKFMFLSAVATNTAAVRQPWSEFRELGNQLFVFRAWLAMVALGTTVITVGVSVLVAWSDIRMQRVGSPFFVAMGIMVLLFLPSMILLVLINWCTSTFIPPIMYARKCPVSAAWLEFRRDVLAGNLGSIVLFLLMRIILAVALIILSIIIGCGTCCIGFLPYLSTVFTLPLSIFSLSYSVYYLQQFGPQYLIIQEPMRMGFDVINPTPAADPNPPHDPPLS